MLAHWIAAALLLSLPAAAQQSRAPVEPPSPSSLLRLRGSLDPTAAVAIRAGFEVDGKVVHEAMIRSNEQGEFWLEWQASEEWTKALLEVRTCFAEVAEAGYQRRVRREHWEQPAIVRVGDPAAVMKLSELSLSAGSDVDVFVVDPIGTPVSADLEGWSCNDHGQWESEELEPEPMGPGHHRVFLEQSRPEVLRALAPGLGAGVAEIGGQRSVRIVLAGPGELMGTLVDLAGQPIAHVTLVASASDDQGSAFPPGPGAGLVYGKASTDGEGRFRIGGLRTGAYSIEVESSHGLPDWALPLQTYATGSLAWTLVLGIQCLCVPLLDEQGQFVADAEAHCVRRSESGASDWVRWEAVPQAPASGAGDQVFFLTIGATYRVSLWSPSRGFVHDELLLNGASPQLESSLRLPDAGTLGTLRVELHVPPGIDLKHHMARVKVREWNSTQTLLDRSARIAGKESILWELTVPPGRYLVDSEVSFPRYCGMAPHSPDVLAPDQREGLVRAGEPTEVELWPLAGSRVRIEILVPRESLGRELAELRVIDRTRRWWGTQILRDHDGLWAKAWLADIEAHSVMSLRFLSEDLGGWSYSGLLPGFPGTSVERLPPGRHRLLVELSGFEPAMIEVNAVDGQDLELTVPMTPRR